LVTGVLKFELDQITSLDPRPESYGDGAVLRGRLVFFYVILYVAYVHAANWISLLWIRIGSHDRATKNYGLRSVYSADKSRRNGAYSNSRRANNRDQYLHLFVRHGKPPKRGE
jgi:hypothetical protein